MRRKAVTTVESEMPMTALRKVLSIAEDGNLTERKRLSMIVKAVRMALKRNDKPKARTWIQREREAFLRRWGVSYAYAEHLWYTEVVAGRRISSDFQMAIVRHAQLECAWEETGERPKEIE